MPTPTQYINQIQLIDRIIAGKVEGLTHADSMKQLPFPGNCMNWNLGHLLVYRYQILGVIDGATEADPEEFAIYGAGSEPLTDSDAAIPLETLVERLGVASEAIVAALQAMPAGRLDEMYDADNGVTIDDRLQFYLIFHESYHTGQLEPLRELALAT
jgi:hypothetical protein